MAYSRFILNSHLHFRELHHGKEWFQIDADQLIPKLKSVIADEILFSVNNELENQSSDSRFKVHPRQEFVCNSCGESYWSNEIHECDKTSWPYIFCKGCHTQLRVSPNMSMFVKCPKCKVKFKANTY